MHVAGAEAEAMMTEIKKSVTDRQLEEDTVYILNINTEIS